MIADTNILLRAIVGDDPKQSRLAEAELGKASAVVIPIPVFCELVWVLLQTYKMPASEVAAAVRGLLDSAKVLTNRPAAEAGYSILEGGGDFADGVIAYEGKELGGGTFVSFDKDAVKLLARHGFSARVPA
jgi:predicted nucleic-acid-binding protein